MNQLIFIENTMNSITNGGLSMIYLFIISCGVYVITSKNPILSVLFLILLFSIVACYLIQLTASFIGLSYLLVYVGAVSILFLFILMLINVRVSELVTDNNNSVPLSLFIISVFIIIFNMSTISNNSYLSINSYMRDNLDLLAESKYPKFGIDTANNIFYGYETAYTSYVKNIIPKWELSNMSDPVSNLWKGFLNNKSSVNIDDNLYYASAYTWDSFITTVSHINSIGNILYTSYPILLFITSIILLLSMIGSIIITVRK